MVAPGDIHLPVNVPKILKPAWDVLTDCFLCWMLFLAFLIGGMQTTSLTFECLAAVDCPGKSRSNMSSSFFAMNQYRNACKPFHTSRKDVVTTRNIYYTEFINSECSKSAVQGFLSNLGLVLFFTPIFLYAPDFLWLKLPSTASIIDSFANIVNDSDKCPKPDPYPYPNPDPNPNPNTVHNQKNGNLNNPNIRHLCDRLKEFKEEVQSKCCRIWILYLLKAILQFVLAVSFFAADIHYMKDLQDTMECKLTQYIPVVHDYFTCSHNHAPTFYGVLKWLYLPCLFLSILVYLGKILWTAINGYRKFKYVFEERSVLSNRMIPFTVEHDLGFLLYLLYWYRKPYVKRVASFLAELEIALGGRHEGRRHEVRIVFDHPMQEQEAEEGLVGERQPLGLDQGPERAH